VIFVRIFFHTTDTLL